MCPSICWFKTSSRLPKVKLCCLAVFYFIVDDKLEYFDCFFHIFPSISLSKILKIERMAIYEKSLVEALTMTYFWSGRFDIHFQLVVFLQNIITQFLSIHCFIILIPNPIPITSSSSPSSSLQPAFFAGGLCKGLSQTYYQHLEWS